MLVAYTACKKKWTSSWTDVKENQIRDQFFEAAFRKDDHVDDVTVVVLIHQFQPKGLLLMAEIRRSPPGMVLKPCK